MFYYRGDPKESIISGARNHLEFVQPERPEGEKLRRLPSLSRETINRTVVEFTKAALEMVEIGKLNQSQGETRSGMG